MVKKIIFAIIGCIVGVLVTYLCMTTPILSVIADKFVALDMNWYIIVMLGVGTLMIGVLVMMIRNLSQMFGLIADTAGKSAAVWLYGNFGKRKSK